MPRSPSPSGSPSPASASGRAAAGGRAAAATPAAPAGSSLARWLVWLVPLVLGLALAWHSLSDLDVWLHDRVGRDLLAGSGLPHRNAFSFTAPDHPWTDHEWLFQVALAAIGAGSPERRAIAWGAGQIALVVWILALFWLEAAGPGRRGRWPSTRRAAALTLPAVAALALLWTRIEPRPELVTLGLFVLALRWIERATAPAAVGEATGAPAAGAATTGRAGSPDQPAAALPTRAARWRPLFDPRLPSGRTFWLTVLWAQLHGFWLLVPMLWLLAALVTPWRPAAGARAAPGPGVGGRGTATAPLAFASPLGRMGPVLATFVAGALTPNGPAGLVYPLHALGQLGGGVDLRSTISEMTPLLSAEGRLGLTVLAFKVCLAWAVLWTIATAGRVSPLRVILLAAGLAAAAYGQRNLGLCAAAFYLAHAGYDGGRPLLWRRSRGPAGRPAAAAWEARIARAAPIASLVVALACAAAWVPDLLSDRFYLRENVSRRAGLGLTPALYPFRVAGALAAGAAGASPKVANDINAASTLVAARAGQVFIDGRTEAYPPEIWRDYLTLRQGGEGALSVLERRRADAVALAQGNPAAQGLLETLLASPRWRLADADDAGALFLPIAAPAAGSAGAAAAEGRAESAARPENTEALRAAYRRLLAELPASGGGTRAADRCAALASLLRRGGLTAEAETLSLRGLAVRPDHPLLNHNYGNLLMARRQWQAAAERFRAALARSPRLVDSRLNLGVCLFQAGDAAGAAAAFGVAARQAPGRAEAWADLAEARLRLGDRAGALEAYGRALRLRPGDQRLRQRVEALGRGGQ